MSKTTTKELKGLFSLEEKTETFLCTIHGSQEVKLFRVFGDWAAAKCPICEKENESKWEIDRVLAETKEKQRQKEYRIEKFKENSGIPDRFTDKTFENYRPADFGQRKASETCMDYSINFPMNYRKGTSFILCGNAGTGKTHLACAIANHVIHQHGLSARYSTIGRAFRYVKSTYNRNSEDSEQDALASYVRPDLLILDEIGVQYGSESEKNILFEIVNERYEKLKPTVLISNLAMSGLTEYAGERVVDRLKENMGKLLIFDWKSHRGS